MPWGFYDTGDVELIDWWWIVIYVGYWCCLMLLMELWVMWCVASYDDYDDDENDDENDDNDDDVWVKMKHVTFKMFYAMRFYDTGDFWKKKQ